MPTSTVCFLVEFQSEVCRFKKIIEYLLSRLPGTFLRLVRVSRHRPHSILRCRAFGDPHEAPYHLTKRHIPCVLILLHGPVIVGRGSGDRAGATNIKSLKNSTNVTLLRNLNRASLTVAPKCATQKENGFSQVLRRERVTKRLYYKLSNAL